MPHLPPLEQGGDKGGDLTGNSDPTHGELDGKVVKSPPLSPPPSGGGRWGITLTRLKKALKM